MVGFHTHCAVSYGSKKKVDISRLDEWFIASEEALCPVQLFFIAAFASLRRA
jgi:hypothetical protein